MSASDETQLKFWRRRGVSSSTSWYRPVTKDELQRYDYSHNQNLIPTSFPSSSDLEVPLRGGQPNEMGGGRCVVVKGERMNLIR